MSSTKINFLAHWIYRVVSIGWFIAIMLFFMLNVTGRQEESEYRHLIQTIKEAPASDYFLYESVTSRKEVFNLWEPLKLTSHRSVFQQYPISWKDFLFCDDFDWTGVHLVSTKQWGNDIPKLVTDIKGDWLYEWELAQNPIWTFVESDCYIKSNVEMCIEWVCKKQQLRSNTFMIRDLL